MIARVLIHAIRQRLAFEVFHDVVTTNVFENIEVIINTNDVFAFFACLMSDADLAEKALNEVLFVLMTGRKNLDRAQFVQVDVFCQKDRSHTSMSKLLDQPVFVGEDFAQH